MAGRRTLAVYWASSCGGCEISVVNLHERLLEVDRHFELVFCPCLVDTKLADVRAMPDEGIDVTLFNGAIRTEENEEVAHLLRRKSRVLVAYGSCAAFGGIPALSNLSSTAQHWATVYRSGVSTDNAAGTLPATSTQVACGQLRLPRFFDHVHTLDEVVDVDYTVPGCPPESDRLWDVVGALVSGAPLPPKGSVLGAGNSTVCDQCRRTRSDKTVTTFKRTFEVAPDAQRCLVEQGLLCLGLATRDGCGALCPDVNMPCIGCYGPPAGVHDQGAKLAGAIGAVMDISGLHHLPEDEVARRVDAAVGAVPDYAGSFYKFSLSASLMQRHRRAAAATGGDDVTHHD